MKLLRKYLTIMSAVLLTLTCFAQDAPATADLLPKPSSTDVVQQVGPYGKIDWTIFQFRAVGIGVAPDGTTGARARVMAREAAIVIAERNLLKVIQGIHISSETTVENLMLVDDRIKTSVEGTLKGATVVYEKNMDDGAYLVTIAIPMLGENSIADDIDLTKQVDETTPKDEVTTSDMTAPKMLKGNYTGLLIDCRGLKVSPAMSPIIYGPDNDAVYPRDEITNDTIINKGVVAYYKSLEIAVKAGRVGNKPLVIKPTGIKKDGDDMWYTSPTVSQADAARILAEDGRSDFMSKLAIGFIVD